MKLIIDVDDELAEKEHWYTDKEIWTVIKAVQNGTPIPDNATNGDVIKAMFDIKEVDMENTYCVHFPEEEEYGHYFFKDWWNAPYQKGAKNDV